MKNDIRIEFIVSKETVFLYSGEKDRKAFACDISNNKINCSVSYDFKEKPLCLQAEVQKDDTVKIVLMPFRIELWVNSVLKDEEWPAGNCLLKMDDEIKAILTFQFLNIPM